MRPESRWVNPQHGDKRFVGNYQKVTASSKREFVLSYKSPSGLIEVIKFDSHEKAKAAKWNKVK